MKIITLIVFLSVVSNTMLAQVDDSIEFKGDLRIRHQIEEQDGSDSRSRNRLRYRFGAKANVNDDVVVHAGLASGGDDQRSTNQTFQDSFSTKGIQLDYAYAEINHGQSKLSLGKMKNPIKRVSDLMWDSDINPEGFSVSHKLNNIDAYITGVYFTLDEISDDKNDPVMAGLQFGKDWTIDDMGLFTAITYYETSNIEGNVLYNAAGTSSGNDVSIISGSVKLSKNLNHYIKNISLFGDVLHNSSESDNNQGYLVGLSIGDKKVNDCGEWLGKVQYRYLESDATLDILPDSDAFGGATGIKGIELISSIGLKQNTVLSIDYYITTQISDSVQENLLQIDLSTKF